MYRISDLVAAMQTHATYRDGYVTIPAYLLEQLHNVVFPELPQYDYTQPERFDSIGE
jgi:hypothetical protein